MEERSNLIRICFQLELAHWFYLDFFCAEDDLVPCGIKQFAVLIFKHVPFLRPHVSNLDRIMDDWKKYKLSVPTYGAILVSASRDNGSIHFTVKDSGIGIPPEDLPRIFERFYRIDKARTRSISGTGLGLAIVKQIITTLHGQIHAEETPGGGLTVVITLPQIEEAYHETHLDH